MYLDTSLVVPCYTPERESAQAVALVQGVSMRVLSDLTLTEARVAIVRKGKRQELTPADVATALGRLEQHVADGVYHVQPLSRAIYDQAWRITQRVAVHLRTLDALHLAFAVEVRAPLGTLDRNLAQAARDLQVETRPL